MQREDDQQLWDLLGRTAEPKLSPFFARNVVREIREEASLFGRAQNWFSLRRLVAASGVAVVVIGMAIAVHAPGWSQKYREREPDVVAKIDPQDFDVVADLNCSLGMKIACGTKRQLYKGNHRLIDLSFVLRFGTGAAAAAVGWAAASSAC